MNKNRIFENNVIWYIYVLIISHLFTLFSLKVNIRQERFRKTVNNSYIVRIEITESEPKTFQFSVDRQKEFISSSIIN